MTEILSSMDIQNYLRQEFDMPFIVSEDLKCIWTSIPKYNWLKKDMDSTGSVSNDPIVSLRQAWAVASILLKTFEFRKDTSISGNFIKGDGSYLSQKELENIIDKEKK